MAFRKKAGLLLQYKPDIVIIPECEHPDKLIFAPGTPAPSDTLWFGNNINKGLGIFSYSSYRFQLQETHNPELRMIIPILVTRARRQFMLYAIWAYNPGDKDGTYVEQVWKAIHHYDNQITNKRTILIGDFNSNTIWDKKHRAGNHSNVVKRLEKKVSAAAIIYFTNSHREKNNTPRIFYTGIKTSPITWIIVSYRLIWQKRSGRLRSVNMIIGRNTAIMCR
jgi:hypothetical protein